jgi:hypothetical protein
MVHRVLDLPGSCERSYEPSGYIKGGDGVLNSVSDY